MAKAVSARLLAQALAARLKPTTPVGIDVLTDNDSVFATDGRWSGGTHLEGLVNQEEGSPEEHITTGIWAALSAIQDFISETLKVPWPDPEKTNKMAVPNVEWEGDRLRLCFGDLEDPVLELPSISLQEVTESA